MAEYRPDDDVNTDPRAAAGLRIVVPAFVVWSGDSVEPLVILCCIEVASDAVSSSLEAASFTAGVDGGVADVVPEVSKYSEMSGKISSSSGKGISLPRAWSNSNTVPYGKPMRLEVE